MQGNWTTNIILLLLIVALGQQTWIQRDSSLFIPMLLAGFITFAILVVRFEWATQLGKRTWEKITQLLKEITHIREWMREIQQWHEGRAAPTSPEPEVEMQSEIQPAPMTGASNGDTIMTTSPSNHPLAGKVGVLNGIIGLILDAAVAALLFYVLAGWIKPPPAGIPLLGLAYSAEVGAIVAAYAYYRLASIFSVNRARNPRSAWVDLIGTIAVAAVLVGAAASFHPVLAAFYAKMGVPTVPYNTFTMTILVAFGIATISYALKYHFWRAEVGLDAVQAGSAAAVPAVAGASISARVAQPDGATSIVVSGEHAVVYLAVSTPGEGLKVWAQPPRVVGGTDIETNKQTA